MEALTLFCIHDSFILSCLSSSKKGQNTAIYVFGSSRLVYGSHLMHKDCQTLGIKIQANLTLAYCSTSDYCCASFFHYHESKALEEIILHYLFTKFVQILKVRDHRFWQRIFSKLQRQHCFKTWLNSVQHLTTDFRVLQEHSVVLSFGTFNTKCTGPSLDNV